MINEFDEEEGWVSSHYNSGYSRYIYIVSITEEARQGLNKTLWFGTESKNRVLDSERIYGDIKLCLQEGVRLDQILISCAAYIGEEGLYWKMTSEEWLAKGRTMPHYTEIDEANVRYRAERLNKLGDTSYEDDPF